jgi:hypothetical protein
MTGTQDRLIITKRPETLGTSTVSRTERLDRSAATLRSTREDVPVADHRREEQILSND